MPELPISPLMQIVLLGIAGIVIWHLQGRNRPNARLITQIAFFAAMTAILVAQGIAPTRYEPLSNGNGTLLVAAKLLWWVHLAWATIGFVRIYVVLDGRPREARLLQDLIVATIYLGVTLSALAYVFGIAIGTLVATSGIIAIILGLALQSTLNDVFSGLALTLGRPYGIGDWILLADGTEGRVVENTWRSTHLLTATNNIVVLPNSFLAKIGLTNVSRPDEAHQVALQLRVTPTHSPQVVLETIRQAMLASNHSHHGHAPLVSLKGLDALAMDIDLLFYVSHPAERIGARNEVADLVYRQCRASGIALAPPKSATILWSEAAIPAAKPQSAQELLRSNPAADCLSDDQIAAMAQDARLRHFPRDELLPTGGVPGLMIIRSGAAVRSLAETEIRRLSAGDIIGELAADDPSTVRALTALEVYELDHHACQAMLRDHPAFRTEILDRQRSTANAANVASAPGQASANTGIFLRTLHDMLRR